MFTFKHKCQKIHIEQGSLSSSVTALSWAVYIWNMVHEEEICSTTHILTLIFTYDQYSVASTPTVYCFW